MSRLQEACEMAIKYKIDICDAVMKQVPMKPIHISEPFEKQKFPSVVDLYYEVCQCGKTQMEHEQYCLRCGQKLRWKND